MNHLEELRAALVDLLSQGTWAEIEISHKKVTLAWRVDLEPGCGKPRYVERVLAELNHSEIVALGHRCLQTFSEEDACIDVQNAIWWLEADGVAKISELTRLEIADGLDRRVMHPQEHPSDYLQRFGRIGSEMLRPPALVYEEDGFLYREAPPALDVVLALFGEAGSAGQPRERYSHKQLMDCFGFLSWPDKRVFEFLENLVHPTVRRENEQAEWVAFLTGIIAPDGFRLVETSSLSGHPVFSVRRSERGVSGTPKNLIFASTGPKPELGFSDAVNNDVVILKHAEHCLVYEERIGEDGILWENLVAWWAKKNGRQPDALEARQALGQRLLDSLVSVHKPSNRMNTGPSGLF